MKTLSIKLLFRPVVGLINIPWLLDLKTKHKEQKEPDYLKNKLFLKSSKYFWNASKIGLEKKQSSGDVL